MSDVGGTRDELLAGRVAVIPTETVYGLAASPRFPDAIDRIFQIKGRNRAKALPILGGSVDDLSSVVTFDRRAQRVAEEFWPGPLTLVLPRAQEFVADLGTGGRASVAVRVPGLSLTRELLAATGPLAVTSANLSGASSAATVDEVRAIFGDRISAYLDGGRLGGRESTIVSLVGEPSILREGPIPGPDVLSGALAS